ncbi:hypothetical protein G6F37_010009 [Rhizopus arrhizus]|nr:hypothetical protein G6F38_002783 [Rhizopus arrhizus]KAG1153824.1 hypothetical protein G6F37_010009 [Rhizopus arrhizus]
MVQLVASKRQKLSYTDHKIPRYSSSFNFSSLTFKQSPQALSISKQNILISAPIQPISNQIHLIAGDLYTHNRIHIQKTHVEIIQNYHKQYTLTHIEWNQKGNAFASIDETGQLALWQLESPIENWKLKYSVNLKQPLAAFFWLNAEREYTDNLIREPEIHLRNPYGHLGFLTVTVHGEITVHYQRCGSLFSSFSTYIPNTTQRDIKRSDSSCFSMSLSGLDDWQRISHAAITLVKDKIYLATHCASFQPKAIQIYTIDIKFPTVDKKGAIQRKLVASACLDKDDFHVTQMVFKRRADNLQLYLGLGEETELGWNGLVQQWELKQVEQSFTTDLGSVSRNRTTLHCQLKIQVDGKYITCLKCTKDGHLAMGLSDGSIHLELSKQGLLKNNETLSYAPYFWCVVQSKDSDDVVDINFSPNETHLLYIHASGKIGIARATHNIFTEEHAKILNIKIQQCLFNNVDASDLTSELIRLSKQPGFEDKPQEIVDKVLSIYESHYQNEEEWNVGQLQKAYGLALTVFTRLPGKQVQSTNLSRGLQLPVILECFISSCSSNYKDITRMLNKEDVHLEFEPNSLWSLVLLSTWVFDYVKWVLHEWNMLLHSKKSQISDNNKAVHSVLFVHKESREYLIKILMLIQHFIRYTNEADYQLDHLSQSQPILQQYANTLKTDPPIAIKEVVNLLNDLNSIESNTKINNRWTVLLKSTLEGYSIPQLRNISVKYKDKCTKPCIYIKKEIIGKYDPIRKRRLTEDVKTSLCTRCHQHILPVHTESDNLDPCSSAQWYQSLRKRCVCGGIYISI